MFKVRDRIASQWAMAKKHLMLVLVFVGILWVVFIVDALIPDSWLVLTDFSIHPRTPEGLLCIPANPFLHIDIYHLMGNTLGLVILGWVLVWSGKAVFLRVCVVTGLISGLGAWSFGEANIGHPGASGVLYGMIGFLLARGWFARRVLWTLVALFVGLMHLGHLLTLLRNDPNISWSSHFWGLVGGIGLAWWMYGRTPVPSSAAPPPHDMRHQ
jgi:membrane associated rhomboid family serine protease